jgi:hypothetical protein
VLAVETETDRFHQVESQADRRGKTRGTPRIRGDFWMNENDFHWQDAARGR